ncbi:UNVERIFIED_ORG: hypothetical protein J2W19_003191 [Shinella zoogloeoides]|nr:hypothetical protein [Shinella zoogloeoides]
MTPYETFMNGARLARNIAAGCLVEAKTADTARGFQLLAEHDRHIERAEDYEMRASWYAPEIAQEIAA